MLKKIKTALKHLERGYSPLSEKILLGLSGGKDSLVCYLLAKEVYGEENIQCFHMSFLPNLRITQEMLTEAISKLEIKKEIKYTLSEGFIKSYRQGYFGWENESKNKIKDIGRKEIFLNLVYETKINNICVGIKKIDNIRIKQQYETFRYVGGLFAPIYDWSTKDVLTYLRQNNIEIPKQFYEGFRGVDLSDYNILYLDRFYPDDLDKIEKFFPFIRATVCKYKYNKIKQKAHYV